MKERKKNEKNERNTREKLIMIITALDERNSDILIICLEVVYILLL